jgi:hypothetical protein
MSHQTRRPGKRGQIGQPRGKGRTRRPLTTDILILSDGTVLAHNLTPVMATVLRKLNPKDKTIKARARSRKPTSGRRRGLPNPPPGHKNAPPLSLLR